jgi:hypothetical protein
MVNNSDAGDVSGLEEVFRAQKLSRTSESVVGASEVTAPQTGQEEALVRTEQIHAATTESMSQSGTGAATQAGSPQDPVVPVEDGLALPRASRTEAVTGGSGGKSAGLAATAVGALWRRDSSRYWTIAALSALVALVVAGVTAGTDSHHTPTTSAQGKHGSARPGSGFHTSGAASTGPTAPGSLTGAVGSGALALGAPAGTSRGSANGPGGHVTLIGAATTTGTAPPSPASNPVTPIASGIGSTVSTVGSSVTGVTNQIGSTIPTAAPAASAVNTVVNAVDQAISATPF